ncbi:tyrosine-type recombinase/integrase [archaeon]|nr:tyrosine-type recombinase/integrase [archaeon]
MAPDDIYGNKSRYENYVSDLNKLTKKPKQGIYYCKNKSNLKYFRRLIKSFEVDDLSYIRRLRLLHIFKVLTHIVNVDIKNINGLERDEIIIKLRETNAQSQLKKLEVDIKGIGRKIFKDEEMPKFFTEFRIKTDIARQIARKDKLSYEEFDKIMQYFSNNQTIQAYLSIAFETLARPQELLYTKISDLDLKDNYAIINISEHGKEGIKKLLVIDSFPYLIKMYSNHKNNSDKNYLFLNQNGEQLTPYTINKKVKIACKKLNIDKPITCYSLKRFGVTYRRLLGDSDTTIQKIAGWNSTRQLKVYDLSTQEDVFKQELIKRGLIKSNAKDSERIRSKNCQYCGELIGFAEKICTNCNHILDRNMIKERIKKDEGMICFLEGIKELKENNNELFEAIQNIGKNKDLIS